MSVIAALILAVSPAAHTPAPAPAAHVHAPVHHARTPARDHAEAAPRPRRAALTLDPAFFADRQAGGVGREPLVLTGTRARLVIIAPPAAPRSAAVEAARRGLGRE